MDKVQMNKLIKEYGILTIATIGTIIENYLFKFPNHFTFGGVTGIAWRRIWRNP